ncbi:MAG: tetratricopeptide repeat protein [Flavobacteriales bacterium]|nr:tetratricopeptide repeat protein [Flavobacteriales bacterium]
MTKQENKTQFWQLALIPTILAFLLYANTLGHQYALDDGLVIQNNVHVQKGLSGLGEIFTTNMLNGINGFNDGLFRPTLLATFAFEIELFGNDPFMFHLFNVMYYMLSAFILSLLLFKLFKNYHVLIALSIALIFVVHPVHTEAVANLKGRDEILAFLFSILSIFYFVKLFEKDKILHLGLGTLFFVLAFISKESAITLVGGIPLTLYFFTNAKKEKYYKVVGTLVVTSGLLLLWHNHIISGMAREMDEGIVSALNNSVVSTDNMLERLSTGAFIQLLYVWKLVVPYFLSHDYSYNQIPVINLVDPKTIGGLILIGGILFVAYKGLIKKNPISFGILFFFFGIITVANVFFYIGATFAERFLYTPSLGYAIILGMALSMLIKQNLNDGNLKIIEILKKNTVYTLVLVSILGLYSFKTITRNKEWENNATLFGADVKIATNSARIHYNWGTELYRQATEMPVGPQRTAKAEAAAIELGISVEIWPKYLDAWNNLGNCQKVAGNLPAAIAAFKQAITVEPTYFKAYYNGAYAFYAAKEYANCIAYLEIYVQNRSVQHGAYYTLGMANGSLGNFDHAIHYLKLALQSKPDYVQAMKDLGTAYGMKKDFANSIEVSLRAVELDPYDYTVLRNIAVGYHHLGQPEKYAEYIFKSEQAKAGGR